MLGNWNYKASQKTFWLCYWWYCTYHFTYIHANCFHQYVGKRGKKCLYYQQHRGKQHSALLTLCVCWWTKNHSMKRENIKRWPHNQMIQFWIKSEATKVRNQVNRVGQKHFTEAQLAWSDMQWIEVSADSGGILVQWWRKGEVGKINKEKKKL